MDMLASRGASTEGLITRESKTGVTLNEMLL